MQNIYKLKLKAATIIALTVFLLFGICGTNSYLYCQTEKEWQLASLKQRYTVSKEKISKLADEVAKLRKSKKRLNRDIKKKNSRIENLTKRINLTQKKFTQLMEEYRRLQKSIKDKDNFIKNLTKKITSLTSQQKDLFRAKEKLKASFKSRKEQLNQLKESCAISRNEAKDLRKEVAQLRKAADAPRAKVNKDEGRSLLLQTIKDKDSTIIKLEERLTDLMTFQKAKDNDQKVRLLLASIRKLSKHKEKIESELKASLEKNRKLTRIIEENELRITEPKEILLNRSGTPVVHAKSNLDVEIRGLKKENEELKRQNRNLKDEIDTILEKYQAKIKQAEQLKNEISLSNLKTEELKRQISSRRKVIKASEGVTRGLRYKVQGLERQKRKLQLEKEQIKEEIDREKLKMHYNLALYYDSGGLYKEAEQEYLNALSIDSDDPEVHYNLGILYDDALNENKKAIYHYRRYLQLEPKVKGSSKVKAWIVRAESDERLRKLAPEAFK